MGSSSIPSSGGASSFPSAGSLAASAFNTSGYYTTTLPVGRYIITAIGAQGGSGYETNNNAQERGNTFSVSAYSSNVVLRDVPYGSPVVLNLTTSEPIYISVTATQGKPWVYSWSNMQNEGWRAYEYWLSANSNIDRFMSMGDDGTTCRVGQMRWTPPTVPALYDSNPGTAAGVRADVYGGVQNDGNRRTQAWGFINNQYFMARGNTDQTMYRSTDGNTWSAITTNTTGTGRDFIFANNLYVVVTSGTTAASNIATSTDGITWTARNSNNTGGFYGITWGLGTYVAVGLAGNISTSTDGVTWVARTAPNTGVNYYRALFQNNIFLIMGDYGGSTWGPFAISTNGTTWTSVTPALSGAAAAAIAANGAIARPLQHGAGTNNGRIFAAQGFFYYYSSSYLSISTNGTTWNHMNIGWGTGRWGYCVGYSATWGRNIGWGNDGSQSYVTYDFGTAANYLIYNSTL